MVERLGSLVHSTSDGNSKEDTRDLPLFSRFLLSAVALGTVDSGYGYRGILTSSLFFLCHPLILRALPFSPHCPISHSVSCFTRFFA